VKGTSFLTRFEFSGFAGIITAAAAWSIWGGEIFPAEHERLQDPAGNPEDWTVGELRRWLQARALLPSQDATREDLLGRVKANMRPPPRS